MVAAATTNSATAVAQASSGATAINDAANGAGKGSHVEAGRNHIVIFPFMAKGHMLVIC
jgi:hypothetical protein